MNIRIYIFFLITLISFSCSKDANKIGSSNAFIKFYGGFSTNSSSKFALNINGGYGIVGTYGTVENKNQIYILNTDRNGITQWQKIIGGKGNDSGKDLKIDKDGNFIVLGDSSYNNFVDSTIFYLIKLSPAGNILWKKSYGSSSRIAQSQSLIIVDDGYLMMGNTLVGPNQVVTLYKTDFNGVIVWQRNYDVRTLPDIITAVLQNSDKSLIWSGAENRYRGSGSTNSPLLNIRLTKTNQYGDILFDRTYLTENSYGDNIANDVKTTNSGFIMIGTISTGSGLTSNKDIFVMNVFNDGSINWVRTYGSPIKNDIGQSIALSDDGGYFICGSSNTTNNKVDIYLNKIDYAGLPQWSSAKNFGGINDDFGQTVLQAPDGGIAMLATVTYTNIPVLTLIKTNAQGELLK